MGATNHRRPCSNNEKKLLIHTKTGMDLKGISWSEKSNPKGLHTLWFHLNKSTEMTWLTNMSKALVVSRLWGSEKAMAPHSSTLAWKIPWMEEPGRLQSMGSQRVGPDWATSLSLFTFMHWRRKWQPTLVFLPGESQGRESLVGCRLWGRTESDTTEVT